MENPPPPMTCYFPNGNEALDDSPCDSRSNVSACCSKLATCLKNGICFKDGLLSRGSCTDESWNSDKCAKRCRDYNSGGGAPIFLCNTSSSGTYWRCGNNPCDNGNTFPMGTLVPTLRSEECSTACPSATPSTNASLGGDCAASFSGGQMAGVGLGIGLPLLIAFLTVLWLLLSERRKKTGVVEREDRSNARNAPPAFESAYQKPVAWNTGHPRDSETIELCGDPTDMRNRNTDSHPSGE